jgi:hypothetical protein
MFAIIAISSQWEIKKKEANMPLFDLFKKSSKKEPAQDIDGTQTTLPSLSSESPTIPIAGNSARNDQFTELLKSIAHNSTDGTGARLILGEGLAPMQEALRNGGRYILVHPQVSQQLEQNNIDPFLVHEIAMRMEMTSRVPQIEFIRVDVDTLLQTWSGKPEGPAPMHVRQALWLQRNAGQFGYEKMGNSWKLKR